MYGSSKLLWALFAAGPAFAQTFAGSALLDQAGYLTRRGDGDAAALAIDEARVIGRRLRCQPLLDRADDLEPAPSQVRT